MADVGLQDTVMKEDVGLRGRTSEGCQAFPFWGADGVGISWVVFWISGGSACRQRTLLATLSCFCLAYGKD